MHDVKKERQQELDEKQKQFLAEKISKFRELYALCFKHRDEGNFSREAMKDVDRLLEINPELYTMWNFKRRTLQKLWKEEEESYTPAPPPEAAATRDGDEKATTTGELSPEDLARARKMHAVKVQQEDLKRELELNTAIITKDYKVYAAFVHRKWCVDRLIPKVKQAVLAMENKKCESLLKVDERNFHVWGHRRWVTTQLRQMAASGGGEDNSSAAHTDEMELAFTSTKIGQNFSNYSAWHNRALCTQNSLAQLAKAKEEGGVDAAAKVTKLTSTLEEEVDLLVRAFYCDPGDQSAWLYCRFVMQSLKTVNPEVFTARCEMLDESCAELIEAEEEDNPEATNPTDIAVGNVMAASLNLKWPTWLQLQLASMREEEEGDEASSKVTRKKKVLLERLVILDPPRREVYKAQLAAL